MNAAGRALIAAMTVLALVGGGRVSAADPDARIVSVAIDPTDLVSGGPFSVTVATTPDIVNVEATIGPHRMTIPEVQSGMYYSNGTVPRFPRFIRGSFHVRFVGKTAAGETVAADTTVRVN
jgi:hypothetical protein